jgi:transcriptional regulator with XRE-family HTH domain
VYPEHPKTLGEHLLKRRIESGKNQQQVATGLVANVETYLLWEKGRAEPSVRFYPAIFRFLGYDLFPPPTSLNAQIASKRRELGLTLKQAAKLAGVDEGTFSPWESGEWKPRMSQAKVDRFLAIAPSTSALLREVRSLPPSVFSTFVRRKPIR